jgi:hypothetical protein
VLDHLAPDAEVKKSLGFKLEKDRIKPTMKQKVRFIIKARERGATESAAPEDAANTIDAMKPTGIAISFSARRNLGILRAIRLAFIGGAEPK